VKTILGAALIGLLAVAVNAAQAATKEDPIMWRDAATLTVEGRGWSDTKGFYDRLPAKAESIVIPSVWWLSMDSAGMVVRFVTDATEINVRWDLISSSLAMNHMAATGVSGVDLYIRYQGKNWRWLAVGKPNEQHNEATLVSGLPAKMNEYSLYLPLYNGVSKVEIGVPEGAVINPAPARTRDVKPVLFYGTSITQGGCACRPGMAYTNIIGRKLDVPIINLGFSGNGRCEHDVADLLTELDPSVFVVDSLPNMNAEWVEDRISYLLKVFHEKHPDTPVVMVEHPVFSGSYIWSPGTTASDRFNKPFEKVYKENAPSWKGKLYYVKCGNLYGDDSECTVDGIHPTDVGFMRMADTIAPVVKKALDDSAKTR
jgi:hypothetical protein